MDPSGMVYYIPNKGGFAGLLKFLICSICVGYVAYYGTYLKIQHGDCTDYTLQDDLHQLKREVHGVQDDIIEIKIFKVKIKRQLDSIEDMLKQMKPSDRLTESSAAIPSTKTSTGRDCHIKQMIRDALEDYNADKTGKVDYALESSGGRIVGTPNTKPYDFDTPVLSVFGIPICQFKKTARALIQSSSMPGECWSFQGSTGTVIIQLLADIHVTGVTLEHISKKIAPAGHIRTAPRDFCIYGLKSASDRDGMFLGRFTYQQHRAAIQQFDIPKSKSTFRFIKFSVTSNHGDPNYTCVYRLRVHGIVENEKKS